MFTSPPAKLGFFNPVTLLATWFGCGLFRWAPGTVGSLGGLVVGWVLMSEFGLYGLVIATLVVSLVGVPISTAYAAAMETKDPGAIVIDEVAGIWLVLCVTPFEPIWFAAAFVLFRLFDIVKPWPVSWADKKLEDGLGVMVDDILAGLYGIIIIIAARIFLGV